MRELSSRALDSVLARSTGEVWVVLVELDHTNLSEPIRVSSDSVDTQHNGNTYISFPFTFELPPESKEQVARMRITFDNVDRKITQEIRQLSEPPSITVKLVLADSPDTVEAKFTTFDLADVNWDVFRITGELMVQDIEKMAYPKHQFTPGNARGLFGGAT